ncbi:hypothetical protein HYS42_01610 [Candidatus Saccharibacteria bacterium]|nr:hypothetical protein [Candidatus Saccharibacteria bacterium]
MSDSEKKQSSDPLGQLEAEYSSISELIDKAVQDVEVWKLFYGVRNAERGEYKNKYQLFREYLSEAYLLFPDDAIKVYHKLVEIVANQNG